MRIVDCYPACGTYRPGEPVRLVVELHAETAARASLALRITHFDSLYASDVISVQLQGGFQQTGFSLPPIDATGGYGVKLELLDAGGEVAASAGTAFDVLTDWRAHPRYGFLCDFAEGRSDPDATIAALARYHVNGLQFYDWQHRHDALVPPSDEYVDCLGRPLSLRVVRALIDAAHRANMAAMPYLAVYAASAAFWRAHPDWALYDSSGEPIPFGDDFLGYMNPAPGAQWVEHLLRECEKALTLLPFDGLHVDQYGEPKIAFDANGREVDLPTAFAAFVQAAKERLGCPVLFNAVGNWPIEELAASPVDFNYIEVWPPREQFSDLARIIENARELSGDRPVTIALYLPAAHHANNLLADAVIYAHGGARIAFGEGGRLLSDPYFPKHEALTPELSAAMRRQADFAVRYGEWTGPRASSGDGCAVEAPPQVAATVRHHGCWTLVHLVNFTGLPQGAKWSEHQPAPLAINGAAVKVPLAAAPRRVLWASADGYPDLTPAEWEWDGAALKATLPELRYWSLLAIEMEQDEA
jgi:dextranase